MSTIFPVRFFNDCPTYSLPKKALLQTARKLVRGEKLKSGQMVDVIICSAYKIRKLNNAYRGKDRVTDVLSFCFNDNDLLGEIYICAQRATAQARRCGLTYTQEMQRLLVHGFIHLLGYDHRAKAQTKRMREREARYCCLGNCEMI